MSSGFVRDAIHLSKERFSAHTSKYEDMDLNILDSVSDMDGHVTCFSLPSACFACVGVTAAVTF